MANKVIVTKILEGHRHAQFHIYLESDGATGELEDHVVIDPVEDLGLESSQRLAIESISYSLSGFTCRIEADTGLVEGKMIWVMSDASSNDVDFNRWGGLYDRSVLDGTGKLQLTTFGFTDVGDQGTILVEVRTQGLK